jgi:hypothetical protein
LGKLRFFAALLVRGILHKQVPASEMKKPLVSGWTAPRDKFTKGGVGKVQRGCIPAVAPGTRHALCNLTQ